MCIGRTNARNDHRLFGIKQRDRFSHLYLIGKTGTGKTTLLENLIRQDLASGRSLALIDPHGDLAERIVQWVPQNLASKVIYFNVTDPQQPYGYNPLTNVPLRRIPLVASGVLEVFKKLWPDAWGVRMEHVMRNSLYALLEQPGANFPDMLRLLADRTFCREVTANLSNPTVKAFWRQEFEKYSYRYRADSIAPIQSKVGAFLADPTLHRILVNPEKPLRLRRIMDEGKILIVNLAKGRIGEDSAALLGALLVTTIGLAAFSRADMPERDRKPFFLYIDEFQTFTTLSLANMTSELRKYGVGLILAHQHLHQLELDVRHAVLGNVGTLISFRVGPEDAAFLSKEFQPAFEAIDLMNLPNYDIYVKLMIDGTPSKPFSATTLPAVS